MTHESAACAVCGHSPREHSREGCDGTIWVRSKRGEQVVTTAMRCACVMFVRPFVAGVQEFL